MDRGNAIILLTIGTCVLLIAAAVGYEVVRFLAWWPVAFGA